MKDTKVLVFDMDGTIADFYGVDGWFESILAQDVKPYAQAKPLVDMDVLNTVLEALKGFGWVIAVTSWLAKTSTNEYDARVKEAKIDWLTRYGFPVDVLNIVPYGTDKSSVTADLGGVQILFDDEEPNLKAWRNGSAVNAKTDIIKFLLMLYNMEMV